jgi:drug/metabolite transporter (DMT)-like permease
VALEIVLLVLASAAMHPVWNLMIKKNPDPQIGYLFLTIIMSLCALSHGLATDADFAAALTVLPLVGVSVFGQVLYGTCLTATLQRGDLSAYYPIIRSSPVFVVTVSVILLGKTYPLVVVLGIGMVVSGGVLLLYRRGTHILGDTRSLLLALLAMCGTGIYSLADAGMMQTIAPPVLVFAVEGSMAFIYAAIWLLGRSTATLPTTELRDWPLAQFVLPGVLAYASYYLILLAYQLGGDVAAVTSMRQASIPISVALGGLFLREGAMARRFFAASLLALGIAIIAING